VELEEVSLLLTLVALTIVGSVIAAPALSPFPLF
jgi:hypothetical protein